MKSKTFEGTWEELLAQHATELAGQRVRLTVLIDENLNHPATETLAQLLQGRVGQVQFQPSDLSERTGEAFEELLANKEFYKNK